MTTEIQDKQARAVELTAQLVEAAAKYRVTPATDEQQAEVDALRTEQIAVMKDVRAAKDSESLHAAASADLEWLRAPGGSVPHSAEQDIRPQVDRRSLGEKFVGSDDFRAWKAQMGTALLSANHRIGNSPPLAVGSLLTPRSALLTGGSATSAGALFMNDQYPGIGELGRRPLTIRDLVTPGTTDSDTVEFVRVTAETNNAAPVAEATATGDGSGEKPESALTFERVTTPVKTIAHWIPATKAALSDAGQLRTLIDAFLRYGLEEELEDQIVNGSGSGDNFTGIFNTSNTQTQAWSTDLFETTRKAITIMRTVGKTRGTAFALSPLTLEQLDLLQDNEGRYYNGGPLGFAGRSLWGYPVVESEALPTGYGLFANWRQAVLWDREQASISVSDSHSDFFIRNLVAILAEMRAAFGVLKPNAFVEIDVAA